jgi:signal transduction histidine kinase
MRPPRRAILAMIPIILLAFSFLPKAIAGEPLRLGPDFSSRQIDRQIDAWVGPAERDPRDLLKAPAERTGDLDFGYTASVIWLRFTVENTEHQTRKWILTINPPLINRVQMTVFDPDGKVVQHSIFNLSRKTPMTQPDPQILQRRRPTFSLDTPGETSRTVVLKIESRHAMDLHIGLSTPEEDEASTDSEQLIFGGYYGLFFAIFFLNAVFFISTRERLFLTYLGFLVSLVAMISSLNGVLDLHFGKYFEFSNALGAFSSMAAAAALMFSRDFLQTKHLSRALDRIGLGLISLGVLFFLINLSHVFTKFSVFYTQAVNTFAGATIVTISAAAFLAHRKGNRQAIFFLIAWGSFFSLTILYCAATYGVIPGGTLAHNAIQIGSSLEMILLSIALGYRMRELKEVKLVAEASAAENETLHSLFQIICHDLRNPLTVVAGHAGAQLSRGRTEWKPVVKAAQTQKEILDYVQLKESLNTRKGKVELLPVSLSKAVEDARLLFKDQMDEKKIAWEAAFDGEDVVLAEPTLLTYTIISNLISNAVKFTHANGLIEIRSKALEREMELLIRDTGIGIPSHLLEGLFSKESGTTRAGTNGERGTGFGLPLVREAVEALGGSVLVQSSSRGTSVILRLRRA